VNPTRRFELSGISKFYVKGAVKLDCSTAGLLIWRSNATHEGCLRRDQERPKTIRAACVNSKSRFEEVMEPLFTKGLQKTHISLANARILICRRETYGWDICGGEMEGLTGRD
jgi:hypothetical protein